MSDKLRNNQFQTVTKYLKKYRFYLYLGGVVVILSNILILITPYLTKLIFDSLEQSNQSDVLKYVILMILFAGFAGIFRFSMRRTIIWMSRHIEYDLRGEIFNHLLRLSPSFYHKNRIGDMMAHITNDLEAVRQMIGPGVMYISDTIIKLTVSFAFMIYLSPKLTLYAILPLIVMPVAVNLIGNILHERSMKIQEKFSELTANAQENLSGIRVIKAYRQENNVIKEFSILSKDYISLNMSLAKIQGLFIPSMRFVAGISYLAVFYFGGMEIIKGQLTLGDIVAYFGYLTMIIWPMIAIGWVTSLYQRGKASLQRINKVLNSTSEIRDVESVQEPVTIAGKIKFNNLSFAYNETPVLKNIDFTIQPGQTIGLIGKTGCGKTTLVALLARLFKVDRGMLFIDDIDINDWPLEKLRDSIGFAPQEPFLFSNTIYENIKFGNENAAKDDIEKAAGVAALTEDIESFPSGFDTIVGERGITLSGGQKQRTAIARAIISNPSIIILDDATSAVDTETEHLINENIKDVLHKRTSIIISHRVSSVKDADTIIYLEDGTIVEQGDHDQLIKSDGYYARLYRSQLLEEELEKL